MIVINRNFCFYWHIWCETKRGDSIVSQFVHMFIYNFIQFRDSHHPSHTSLAGDFIENSYLHVRLGRKKENEDKVDESHVSTCIFYWFACQIHFCFFALRMGCVELWFLLPYCRFFILFCLMKFASCFREVGDILRPINLFFVSSHICVSAYFCCCCCHRRSQTKLTPRIEWINLVFCMRFGFIASRVTYAKMCVILFQKSNGRHRFYKYLLIMRNGAARLMPMNSMPKYMAKPNAANVAIIADRFPSSPSHGFDRTTSPIMHVIMLHRWGIGKIWIFSLIFSHLFVFLFSNILWQLNECEIPIKWNDDHSLHSFSCEGDTSFASERFDFDWLWLGVCHEIWHKFLVTMEFLLRNVWSELTWMLPSRRMSMKNMAQRFVYSVPIRGRVCVTQIGRHLCA